MLQYVGILEVEKLNPTSLANLAHLITLSLPNVNKLVKRSKR